MHFVNNATIPRGFHFITINWDNVRIVSWARRHDHFQERDVHGANQAYHSEGTVKAKVYPLVVQVLGRI